MTLTTTRYVLPVLTPRPRFKNDAADIIRHSENGRHPAHTARLEPSPPRSTAACRGRIAPTRGPADSRSGNHGPRVGAWVVDVGLGIASEPVPVQTSRESVAETASPVQVYRSACLRCHDSDGRGQAVRDALLTISDFTCLGWHAPQDDEDLGLAKFMPRLVSHKPTRVP